MKARAVVLLAALAMQPPSAFARDNILVVMVDDVGVDAIGVYGEGTAPGPTPTIDQLAAEGVLFRNAYTNAQCAPSRAQALTGRHGFRTGIGVPGGSNLALTETTIPEFLALTHRTAAIGKWHIGSGGDIDHPIDSGFEYYAGGLSNLDDYSSWDKVTNSSTTTGSTQTDYDTYATTDAADEAIAKIAEFGDDEWFVWLAFHAPHGPFHVPPDELTTISVDAGSDNPTKFKAALEALDTELGRVLASIPADVREDTTIIFIGDNGTPGGASEAPFTSGHAKGSMYEGGINVPLIVYGPLVDEDDYGTESQALVQSVDIFATIAEITREKVGAPDSVSLVPYLEDPSLPTSATRLHVYAERFEPNGPGPYTDHRRGARDERYKLIWRDGVYEEFFDLDEDAFEADNLLPVGNLSSEELAAYNALVATMETADASLAVSCPTAPDLACTTGFEKATFDWKVNAGKRDKFNLKLLKGPALTQTDFGDPIAAGGTAYGVCIYDDADALIVQLQVVRGGDTCKSDRPCWKALGGDPPDGSGYKYNDSNVRSDGVQRITVKGGDVGKSKVQLKGKGHGLPDDIPTALLTTTSVTVQFRGSDATQCLSHTVSEITTQEPERFKAK